MLTSRPAIGIKKRFGGAWKSEMTRFSHPVPEAIRLCALRSISSHDKGQRSAEWFAAPPADGLVQAFARLTAGGACRTARHARLLSAQQPSDVRPVPNDNERSEKHGDRQERPEIRQPSAGIVQISKQRCGKSNRDCQRAQRNPAGRPAYQSVAPQGDEHGNRVIRIYPEGHTDGRGHPFRRGTSINRKDVAKHGCDGHS